MQRNLWRVFRRFSVVERCNHTKLVTVSFSSETLGDELTKPPKDTKTDQYKSTSGDNESHKTHFGFETVTEQEKEQKVYNVFHNVAEKYDLMNDVMSGGIHRLWKDYFIYKMHPVPGTRLLDVAGGTGDIAFRFLDFVKNQYGDGKWPTAVSQQTDPTTEAPVSDNTHVTVCDINKAMLDVGKRKAITRGLDKTGSMSWILGNAEQLPVADESFDVYTVAFGIRNMTHIETVLSEAYRVLRQGGRFMCLEFSEVSNPLLRRAYDAYSFQVLPVMGQVIAGDWKSYQYLVESIRQFPCQEDFKEMIEDAGFCSVTYENLMFGVAAIHSGFKL